jgi:hypothetical protein
MIINVIVNVTYLLKIKFSLLTSSTSSLSSSSSSAAAEGGQKCHSDCQHSGSTSDHCDRAAVVLCRYLVQSERKVPQFF